MKLWEPHFLAQATGGHAAWAKWVAAAAGSVVGYVLPAPAERSLALATGLMVLVDTATGLVKAWHVKSEKVSSAKFSRVLVKLFGYSSVVIVVGMARKVLAVPPEWGGAAVSATLTLFFATESLSVLENVHALGLPVPKFLRQLLDKAFKEAS